MAKVLTTERLAGIAILIAAIVAISYLYTEHVQTADLAPWNESYDITVSTSDRYSGESVDSTIRLVSGSYDLTRTTTAGGVVFTGVPRGVATFTVENSIYYDQIETKTFESRTREELSHGIKLDNIGTFSWSNTPATLAPTVNDNSTLYLNIQVYNSEEDSVIRNLQLKMEISEENASIDIKDVVCTTHTLETDDDANLKYIVSGGTIGNLVGLEVETIQFKIPVEITTITTGTAYTITLTAQDLSAVNSLVTSSKTVTATSA